jgi:hypothetical protein
MENEKEIFCKKERRGRAGEPGFPAMIYLIITSSIIDKDACSKKDDEFRKSTYLNSIRRTLEHIPSHITPILVENNGKRETYLDGLGISVFYTENNNRPLYIHKALNELDDIKDVIKHFNIQDEDTIIKLTGRYYLYHPYFFNLVSECAQDYDVFMKFLNVSSMQYDDDDCVMGLYAMRCKYLKRFNFQSDCTFGKDAPSPEVQFCKYTKELNCRIYRVDFLYATFCFADDLFVTDL